ncbi:hypothetical protein O77CONTIG1_01563 [Leptolyngbya sp. O-77]|nr:hypothetical protein O77CONTIG1_01563 [Leptolyngbya sp. O-77]
MDFRESHNTSILYANLYANESISLSIPISPYANKLAPGKLVASSTPYLNGTQTETRKQTDEPDPYDGVPLALVARFWYASVRESQRCGGAYERFHPKYVSS